MCLLPLGASLVTSVTAAARRRRCAGCSAQPIAHHYLPSSLLSRRPLCLSCIFIAAARLLRRRRHCRRTVSNADVDAPLTLRSLLCILITGRHHSCRAVNSASADCLLLVAGAACLPCYCVKRRACPHCSVDVDAPLTTTCNITLYADHHRLSYFCRAFCFV